jgi:hypothetical protein
MKNERFLWLAFVLAACGSNDQVSTPSGSGSSVPCDGATGPSVAGLANARNAGDNAPERDDPQQFARRFAAVSEVVGEAAAKRVMTTADVQALPLYKLALPNGNSIEWYEILDGVAVAVESGSSASSIDPALKLRKMTATELFSALAPGSASPAELVQLDQRQLEMAPIYRSLQAAADRYSNVRLSPLHSTVAEAVKPELPLSNLSAGEGVGQVQLGLSSAECFAQTIACSSSPVDWRVLQADRTANATINRSDTQSVVGIGCTQSGQVTYRVRYRTWFTWTTWFGYDVPAGAWVGPWHFFDNVLDFDFESRLYNFEAGDKASQCAAGHD